VDGLSMEVGRASWGKVESGMTEVTTTYNVTRKKVWVLSDVPHHYAQDRKTKVTSTTGYSTTKKTHFEETFEAGASGALFGWSADVKASLHLSDEIEQQWRTEQTVETEVTFQAAHWYASWSLVDTLLATKIVMYKEPLVGSKTVHANSDFQVVLTVYDDVSADGEMKRAAWSNSTTTIFLNDASNPTIFTTGHDYSPLVKETKLWKTRISK
jgi:hypothetical protein